MTAPPQPRRLAAHLLRWYDAQGRRLSWRAPRGERSDPYRVWLSEVMLQQTRVAAATPYIERFLRRWPTVGALAEAAVEDVMEQWAGFGYYARARNLHRCAQAVVGDHGGVFPRTEAGLMALPGIGPYTAAAVAAIAFDDPAVVVDGNVERVIARLHAVHTPLPSARPELRNLAASLVPKRRAGDYAQALMDLGATVCTAPCASLRRLPLEPIMRGVRRRGCRVPAQTYPAANAAVAVRSRLLALSRRWRRPPAPPSAEGAAGRNARSAEHRVGGRSLARERGAKVSACRRELAALAGDC